MDSNALSQFELATGLKPRGVPGAKLTTLAVGGLIAGLVEPETIQELTTVLKYLNSSDQKYRVIGGGSNLLISDNGLSDWVIRLSKGFRYLLRGKGANGKAEFEVGGAMSLMSLTRDLSDQGFSGLEFAGGIPASLGGAVRMNAGAHGGQMSDLISKVTYLNAKGDMVTEGTDSLKFEYRNSSIPADAVVISAVLLLAPSDRETTNQLRNHNLAERKKRQPLHLPSAGSVFKNPSPENTAGMLIEKAGLKGFTEGGAEISALHANWIVNPKRRATSSDVLRVIEKCRDTVRQQSAIDLHTEVIYWE